MTDQAVTIAEELPRPKTGAERARAYRERRRQATSAALASSDFEQSCSSLPVSTAVTVTSATPVTSRHEPTVTAPRPVAVHVLTAAALCLAGVGIIINGWFARSLGSSEIAGWLFLAMGVATDCVALTAPTCAAHLWSSRQRMTALVAWAVWLMTLTFAVTASVGFASVNIADVTADRASRLTPAVQAAQISLADAMAARDRECKGGVGRFCRDRETEVAERRQILDSALAAVEQTADPQTNAAIKLIAWASRDVLKPTANDFAMLRLTLLALLPQIGGILLMVGRSAQSVSPGRP